MFSKYICFFNIYLIQITLFLDHLNPGPILFIKGNLTLPFLSRLPDAFFTSVYTVLKYRI